MSVNCISLTPKVLTVDELRIGKWNLRLADADDVTASEARTVGDRMLEHDNDGIVDVDEADTP